MPFANICFTPQAYQLNRVNRAMLLLTQVHEDLPVPEAGRDELNFFENANSESVEKGEYFQGQSD